MWHDWLSIGGYLIGNCAKQILEILELTRQTCLGAKYFFFTFKFTSNQFVSRRRPRHLRREKLTGKVGVTSFCIYIAHRKSA